jgi:hypothetical protein
VDIVLDSQPVGIVATQPYTASALRAVSAPSRKRQVNTQGESLTKRQTALRERNINSNTVQQENDVTMDTVLVFTPRTKAGRIRKVTLKGQENLLIEL